MKLFIAAEGCGNSPKAKTLVDFANAIALADAELLGYLLIEDVEWVPVNAKVVSGKTAVCRSLVRHGPATALWIHHVITHGRSGAIDGVSEHRRKQRAFYIVVDFSSARGDRIRRITSFSTAIRQGGESK